MSFGLFKGVHLRNVALVKWRRSHLKVTLLGKNEDEDEVVGVRPLLKSPDVLQRVLYVSHW